MFKVFVCAVSDGWDSWDEHYFKTESLRDEYVRTYPMDGSELKWIVYEVDVVE